MKQLYLLLTMLIFLTACQAQTEPKIKQTESQNERFLLDETDTSHKSFALVQSLSDKTGYGTAFFVSQHQLLTNKHVVNSSDKPLEDMVVRRKTQAGQYLDYKITKITEAPDQADLVILDIEATSTDAKEQKDDEIVPLELAKEDAIKKIQIGDSVQAIGYPGDKDYGSLWKSTGAVLENDLKSGFLSFSAVISGGSSGSPLLNADGQVIGLVNAASEDTQHPQAFAFLLTKNLQTFLRQELAL